MGVSTGVNDPNGTISQEDGGKIGEKMAIVNVWTCGRHAAVQPAISTHRHL